MQQRRKSVFWSGAVLMSALAVSACGTTSGGGAGGDAGPTGGGETPTGGTGGAGGDVVAGGTGGTGGTTPVGGSGGAEPVGGEGGAGGQAIADAAVATPDAAPIEPDAAVVETDAAVVTPDAAIVESDAAVVEPDAAAVPADVCEAAIDFLSVAVADGPSWVAEASIDGGDSQQVGTCGGNGPEVAFRFIAPAAGLWRFETAETPDGSFYDTVLYARSACADDATERACADEGADVRDASRIELELLENEEIYLVLDAFRANTAGVALLVAQTQSTVAIGETCDPFGFPRACPADAVCADTADGLQCVEANPPTIDTARVVLDAGARSLWVTASGADIDANADVIEVQLLDFRGIQFGFPESIPVTRGEGGAYTVAGPSAYLDAVVPYGVLLTAVDSTGQRSQPFLVSPLETRQFLAPGDACHPDDVAALCGGSTSCVAGDVGFTCVAFDGICDAAAATLSDVMPDAQGRYVWAGDTRQGQDNGMVPCRTGMQPEQLVRFVAPSDGRWRFTVDPTAGDEPMTDSVLAIRAACAADGPALVCNDDGGGDVRLGSGGIVELAAGEVVILQVEAYNQAGTYEVSAALADVAPVSAPVLDAATFEYNGVDDVRVTAVGTAGEGVVDQAWVDLYREGSPLLLGRLFTVINGAPANEMFDLAFDILHEPLAAFADTAVIRVGRFDGPASNPVEVPVMFHAPAVLARGDICSMNDPWPEALCGEGDFCLDADADPATPNVCAEIVTTCPEEFAVTVVDTAVPGPYTLDGDLTMAPAALAARCDRGQGEQVAVYEFTAPAAGRWAFETGQLVAEGRGGDSVISVRSACALPDPQAVLACDDDGAGMLASRAFVQLEQGQTVYVAVYGFASDALTTFTLTISQTE